VVSGIKDVLSTQSLLKADEKGKALAVAAVLGRVWLSSNPFSQRFQLYLFYVLHRAILARLLLAGVAVRQCKCVEFIKTRNVVAKNGRDLEHCGHRGTARL